MQDIDLGYCTAIITVFITFSSAHTFRVSVTRAALAYLQCRQLPTSGHTTIDKKTSLMALVRYG
jgi:hypothetical protein